MSMNIEDRLRADLHDAARQLMPSGDLLGGARRRGRQRRRRTRAVAAVVVAAVTGGVVVASAQLLGRSDRTAGSLPAVDQELLSRPTGGDLAGDNAYLAQVTAAWKRYVSTAGQARLQATDLRGEPRVIWAGKTNSGNVAVVVQDAQPGQGLVNHENLQRHALIGFVGTGANGRPTVLGNTFPMTNGYPGATAFLAGPRRTTLLVLDAGVPLKLSWGVTYKNGLPHRSYLPVRFSSGGVAEYDLPAGTDRNLVYVVPTSAGSLDDFAYSVANGAPPKRLVPNHLLPWTNSTGGPVVTGGSSGCRNAGSLEATVRAVVGANGIYSGSIWCIADTTHDGSQVQAEEWQLGAQPSRIYVQLTRPGQQSQVIGGGIADSSKPLWVKVKLPQNEGWVVGRDKAALSYQDTAGHWHSATRSGAVLPPSATAVKVTVPGHASTTVPLR